MTLQLLHSKFPYRIYDKNLIFFFISVPYHPSPLLSMMACMTEASSTLNWMVWEIFKISVPSQPFRIILGFPPLKIPPSWTIPSDIHTFFVPSRRNFLKQFLAYSVIPCLFSCFWDSHGHSNQMVVLKHFQSFSAILDSRHTFQATWGRILGRNPDRSLKSFLPCYLQLPLQLCHQISVSSNSRYLLQRYCTQ